MEELEQKVPLVLFSGGMDSTYLLQFYLDWTNVETMYVQANTHPDKVTKELEARQKLMKLFEKYYKYRVLDDHQVNLTDVWHSCVEDHNTQPISWLTAALLKYNSKRHSAVAIGYLLGDQAPAYREQLEGFWRNGWMLLRGRMSPPPPLLFPLLDQHVSKASVVRDIDKCLIMSTWVCEIPNTVGEFALKRIVPCKRCQPCRLLRNTIENWEEDNNKKYYTEAIKALNPDLYPPNDPCKEIAV